MSTGISMALVVNLLPLLLSAALVRSDQSMAPLISFKISENVTYDCIDIYKQPGLDHPSLRNHTLQMQPSDSKHEINNKNGNNKTYRMKIECPEGTVPILRNSKELITNAQVFAEKYAHPLSADHTPGTHIAGVRSSNGQFRGVAAWSNAYNLNIGQDQASYSQIYIGSGLNDDANFISAGLMINPSHFGDGRVWSYGFWKGKDGKGCYNTACYGFVQVSNKIPIVEPIDLKDGKNAWLHCTIYQDKQTGNWWIKQFSPDEVIGYWPKELFNLLDNGATMVGAGGVVQASSSGSSPPMGNGHFPNENFLNIGGSALVTNVEALDSNNKKSGIDYFPLEILVDSPKCYGIKMGSIVFKILFGYFFNYGGPGGNSCGV